jgi:succinoglycan biosynthesis protein ExoO
MRVSVVIPAFNVEQCVDRAVVSALHQTMPPLEIIVVDDGSTDATIEVVNRLKHSHPSIRIITHPRNRGPAAARNSGITEARGEWIAILDADDRFEMDRLRYLVRHAQELRLDLVADNMAFYDKVATAISRLAFREDAIGDSLTLDLETFLMNCQTNDSRVVDLGLLKPIMKRNFLNSHELRYDEASRHGEDFLFYFRALAAGASFRVFPRVGYFYTERVGSISGAPSRLSRTRINYDRMRRETLALLNHDAARSERIRDLLIQRAERIAELSASHLRQSFRERKFRLVARTLFTNAASWRVVNTAVRQRLSRVVRRIIKEIHVGSKDL